jgi:hypothetical protein
MMIYDNSNFTPDSYYVLITDLLNQMEGENGGFSLRMVLC